MSLLLAELAEAVPAGTHAVLILDRAGWHISEGLSVPANLTVVHRPPCSPELNAVERVADGVAVEIGRRLSGLEGARGSLGTGPSCGGRADTVEF